MKLPKFLPLLISLGIIIVWASLRSGISFGVETDFFGCYAPLARDLLQSGQPPLDNFRGPLYPALLAIPLAAGLPAFQSAILLNLLAIVALWACLSGLLHHFAIRSVWPLWFALTAPVLLFAAVQAGTDVVFAALVTAFIWAVVTRRAVPAALLLAAAALTRTPAVALIPLLFVRFPRPTAVRAALITAAPIILWSIVTYTTTGHFFYNLNYLNTAALAQPDLDVFWYDKTTQPTGWLAVLSNPAVLLGIMNNIPKVLGLFLADLLIFPIVPLALFLLICQPLREQKLLLAAITLLLVPLFLTSPDSRYMLPLVPILSLYLHA